MELQGKIITALEPRSGTSARGEWTVQSFVVETHEQYPKKMVFEVFGSDRLQRFNIQVGQEVNVSFDIDAHEYNGRWYNSIRAFDVRQIVPGQQPATGTEPLPPFGDPAVAQPAAPAADPFGAAANGQEEDTTGLPF